MLLLSIFVSSVSQEGFNMDLLNDDFGKRLKLIRESKEMTQIELAKKTSLSNQIISNLERGYTKSISYVDLSAIAKALKCKIGDLVPGAENFSSDLPRDIDRQIKSIYDSLNSDIKLKINNKVIDKETRELIKISLDSTLKIIEVKSISTMLDAPKKS